MKVLNTGVLLNRISTIMGLADNMAAAATMFNAHGYDNFIESRDQLIDALKNLEKDLSDLTHQVH